MKDHPSVILSLTCADPVAALDFYTRAFGAKELFRLEGPGGELAHAEFTIGNTRIMLSGPEPGSAALAPPTDHSSHCSFAIMVDHCDEAFGQAKAAGIEVISEPQDQFYGLREAQVRDPEGYRWHLGQVLEELSPEEIKKRARALFGGE